MINVSNAFKRELYNNNRQYVNRAVITLADGTVLDIDNSRIMQNGIGVDDAVGEDDSFTALGSTIINSGTVTLYNNDEVYSDYDFYDAKMVIYTGLTFNGITESIKKGTFTVDDATYNNSTITLTGLDNMEQFDRPYKSSTLAYPATLASIVNDACSMCDVPLDTSSLRFPHYDFVIENRPVDDALTYREVLGHVATIAGCFARVNADGRLELKWFDVLSMYEAEEDYDGGIFDSSNPYSTGANINGGTFNPWNDGANVVADEFTVRSKVHYITSLYSQNIGVDDVVITGVRISVKTDLDMAVSTEETTTTEEEEEDIKQYVYGTLDYAIDIEENSLITTSNVQTILAWLGPAMVGLRFRKCSVTHASDPTIEAGDVALIWDTKGNEHPILITRASFQPYMPQAIVCGAETPARNVATRFSEATKVFIDARRKLREQRDTYQAAMDDLRERVANASGLYKTEVLQQDGSSIIYYHDKPTLAESEIQLVISSVGITVTPDGGDHWYGLTVDGELISSIMYTIGINFDWGVGGRLVIKKGNNVTFSADADTGDVTIVADSFSLSDGTTLSSVEQSAKNYAKDYTDDLDDSLTQSGIFNRLTNNGQTQGIYLQNGKLYINGTFMKMGKIESANSRVYFDLDNNELSCSKLIASKIWDYASTDPGDMVVEIAKLQDYNNNWYSCANIYKSGYSSNGLKITPAKDSYSKALITNGNGVEIRCSNSPRLASSYNSVMYALPSTVGMQVLDSSNNTLYGFYVQNGITNVAGDLGVSDEALIQTLTVSGTKNRLVKTANYGERKMDSYELTSPMFGDVGEAVTDEDGVCVVSIDDIFREVSRTDIEYQVFLQKEGEGDIWVDTKEPAYFIVKGTPNLKFAWELKAKQRDYETYRTEERVKSVDETGDLSYIYSDDLDTYIAEQEEALYEAIE